MIKLFITGTDTLIGKTYISVGLLEAFNQKKFSTLGVKPVASESFYHDGKLINPDAKALQDASSIKLSLDQINPFNFEPPISPHIAALKANQSLNVKQVLEKSHYALNYPADVCIVEGVGGWNVPLNDDETMADVVKALQLKTILVVGMRLGCINHALLTYRAVREDHVPIIGWVANCVAPSMLAFDENIATLKKGLPVPYLGTVGHLEKPAPLLDIDNILTNFR